MIDLDEIGRIERRREPWGVGRVDSTADTGADERPACPPKSGGAGAP